METVARWSSTLRFTRTGLSAGEYFSALAIRLLETRPIREGSASTRTGRSGASSSMLRAGCSSAKVRICSTSGELRSTG